MDTLESTATTSTCTTPPTFQCIAANGVEGFDASRKTLKKVGVKRKHKKGPSTCESKRTKVDSHGSVSNQTKPKTDPISYVVKLGRPRLKRLQRKRPSMPRQVSSPNKKKMLQSAAILRRGDFHCMHACICLYHNYTSTLYLVPVHACVGVHHKSSATTE